MENTSEPTDVRQAASLSSSSDTTCDEGADKRATCRTLESNPGSAKRLNYFNYFTEVEEEFVRRRGKQLLISPMDWALVESWKDAGIPLHIVLRSINESFDAYDARAQKHRKVNSIFYCQQAVEGNFAEYRLAQVGGGSEIKPTEASSESLETDRSAFPKEVILEFLARCEDELRLIGARAEEAARTEIGSAAARARARLTEIASEIVGSARANAESLERDLDAIDRMILDAAARECGEEELKKIRADAATQLRSYKKKMDKSIYEQTVQNFVSRRLREINNIPRMSLFYL
ncbi:MAG TPA: hypothetical protein VN937_03630 [Blastocatellia bacterium]|nr:hypothetical protein [Blastocatellia bacterium]